MNLSLNALRLAAIATWLLLALALAGLPWVGAIAAAVLVSLAVWWSPRSDLGWRGLIAAVAIAASAMGSFSLQAALTAPSRALAESIDFETHELTLRAIEPGQVVGPDSLRVAVRLVEIDGHRPSCLANWLPESLCAPRGLAILPATASQSTESGAPGSGHLLPGTVLQAQALLTPAERSGRATFIAKLQAVRAAGAPFWLASSVQHLHDAFTSSQHGVSTQADALVAGIAIGQTNGLSADLKGAMQTTGLTHLTAVSGANCVIVAGLVFWLLSRTRATRLARGLITLATLVVYVLVVGQQPSVLRAATMFAFAMLPRLFGWRIRAIDSLSFAVIALLFADPWLAIDYGFALSALATLGLVIGQKPIARLLSARLGNRLPTWVIGASAVVLSAQLLCLPLILVLSGALPTYTLPANLIVEPLIAPITVLGILAVAVAVPIPWAATALGWLASVPASWVAVTAHWFAELPLSRLDWLPGWSGVILSLAITVLVLFAVARRRLSRTLGIAIALCASVALSFGLSKPVIRLGWPEANWSVVACDVGQGDALVLRSQGKIAVIDVGREAEPVDSCLDSLGVSTIDLLVLTHYDADHVGGLSGVLQGRTVSAAIESPWSDDRPMAAWARRALRVAAVPVTHAEDGLNGRLGGFRWLVLNPSRTASEVEDSNDGSVAMYWQSADLNLLALADLGERGQQRLVSGHEALLGQVNSAPLVLKVAHHGSADCYQELYEALRARVALVSVGANNGYGHPTRRALEALNFAGTRILRTDLLGSVAITARDGTLGVSVAGGG